MASSFHLEKLLRRIDLDKRLANEFQKALTHFSFYQNKEDKNAQVAGRYIFLGQYGFKGEVANYLFEWISGTGTQIQHFLDNLFKNKILEKLFDTYELHLVIRVGDNFDIQSHKHIFVYAFLGFVLKHSTQKQLVQFISSEIITPNPHLFPSAFQYDALSQLRYKTKQVLEERLSIETKIENDFFVTCIKTETLVLAEATSKSKVYSRKKAVKEALKKVIELELELNPYLRFRFEEKQKAAQQKQQQQQEAKLEAYRLKKTEAHRERKERIEKSKRLAQHKDKLRREAKKRAKDRHDNQTTMSKKEIKKLLNEEGHLMNAAKRRRLEDKLK